MIMHVEYECQYCGHRYVVPGLARDCETRHEKGEHHVPSNA